MKRNEKVPAPLGCLVFVICVLYFPIGVILELAKQLNKPKRRKTGGRGHRKKDYWPHN